MRLGIVGTRMFLAMALLGQMSLVVFGQSPNPHAAEPATKSAETKSPAAAKPSGSSYLSAAELRIAIWRPMPAKAGARALPVSTTQQITLRMSSSALA
jgi:hypothetical protein